MNEFDVFLIGFGFGVFAGAGLMGLGIWLRRRNRPWYDLEV